MQEEMKKIGPDAFNELLDKLLELTRKSTLGKMEGDRARMTAMRLMTIFNFYDLDGNGSWL